jgi:5'-nucleotidase
MSSKIILVDLDGPLADLEGEFLKRWREQYPSEFFVPFDQRKNFFLNDDYPEHLRGQAAAILATSGFFADLPVVPGGIEAVKKMAAAGHKVFLCTSDIYANKTGLTDKRAWVERYLGRDFAKAMIFARDKTLIRGNLLIDDKLEITGVCAPEWQQVVYDQPFNRSVVGKLRITMDWSNWEEVVNGGTMAK